MSRGAVPVYNQYYSALRSVQYYHVPNVTSCLICWERAPLQRCSSIPRFVTITKCHQQSSVLCLCCVVNVCYVSILCYQVKPVKTLCTLQFLLTSNGEKTADEAIGVKKGGFMWYFSLPSTSISSIYLWYSLSVTYRVRLALRGSR